MAQMTQDNTPGYTLREQWRTMPMKEYAETFRDFGRVRGYCHGCGRYGKCWACPPYDFAEDEYLGQFTTISLLATKITPSEGVALTPETAERILNRERQRLDRGEMHPPRGTSLPPSGKHPPVPRSPRLRHRPHGL